MVARRLHNTLPQIEALYDRGVKSVIPLLDGKNPGYGQWQKVSDEEAQDRIWSWQGGVEKINFGIRLGPAHGNLCDIDLDSKESKLLAKYYLPPTARFGRGGVCTHYLYHVSGKAISSKRYQWDKRDEKTIMLEIRYSGQTMGPGSHHPTSGEVVEWMSSESISDIDSGELVEMVNQLGAASLLLRDWATGGRDELALCLVGAMIRSGWSDEDADSFLEPILVESGDEEAIKRLKASRLRAELVSGGRVPGLPRLRELCTGGGIGLAGFERVVEWLELGSASVVEEMNAEYAVCKLIGGGVAILHEDPTSRGVSFLDQRAMSLLHANRKVLSGGRELTADKYWLGHPERREYRKGVVFKPGQDADEGEYNLWSGFAVAESEGGVFGAGWEVFHDHLRDNVCRGDEDVFQWLLGWMAHRVQRPWEVPQSAVVLIGERGDGKSSVFKIFGRLFGRHYMSVTQTAQLLGKFNQHLMDKVLVLADEAVWGGSRESEGVLKVLITEDRRTIEIKGGAIFDVDNCLGVGICSNNDWVVPVGRHERRFLVLRTGRGVGGDLDFWDRMYSVMSVSGGGLGRMLWDLKRFDLTGWRGNRPPMTDAAREQQDRGTERWVQFLRELDIQEGEEFWEDTLYEKYLVWHREQGYRWGCETKIVFFKQVTRMFPWAVRTRVKLTRVGVRDAKRGRIAFHRVAESQRLFMG